MSDVLGILGIAMKAGFVELGEERSGLAVRDGKARVLVTASDASERIRRRTQHFLETSKALHIQVDASKEELGGLFGKSTVAILAVTDIGLAENFVKRLEAESPGKYTETLEELRARAEKARQRKKETQAHERNRKTGKKGSAGRKE